MKYKLNWNLFSNQERYKIIEALKSIISSNGGYIINSNFFSDLALSLTVEIEEKNIVRLHSALRQEMTTSELDKAKLDQDSTKEWWVFININFSKGTGNLKINIPDISS